MYLKRQAEQELDRILSGTKVGIVLGARQVGKTTLVEQVLRERQAVFLNLDVEVDKARFKAAADLSPADVLRSFGNPQVLVIDEAQRLPEVSRIVKGWHDTRLPVKLLLLGSSSLDLLDQAAESLAGRNRKPILPPVLFAEALHSQAWAVEGQGPSHLCKRSSHRRVTGRAFRDAYGAAVERIGPKDPFVAELLDTPT